jgi:hypothetical protein
LFENDSLVGFPVRFIELFEQIIFEIKFPETEYEYETLVLKNNTPPLIELELLFELLNKQFIILIGDELTLIVG